VNSVNKAVPPAKNLTGDHMNIKYEQQQLQSNICCRYFGFCLIIL